MTKKSNRKNVSRRDFVKFGGAAIAGSALRFSPVKSILPQEEEETPKIKKTRVLGRTGFKVSDVSIGTTRFKEANVLRYAYDCGVNYFDTAEGYGNGLSERLIGEALQHMDRKQVFITTKLHIDEDATQEEILDRFKKCQERLNTPYVDALYMHNPRTVSMLNHEGFHAVVDELKSQGKLKHAGLSSHGGGSDSMEEILCAAAEDGRFDLMLLVYNFMNKETGDNILAACKKHNIGATAMKTTPGSLEKVEFNPDSLTQDQQEYVDRIMKRGTSEEKALQRLKRRIESRQEDYEKTKPFAEKYGIKTEELLRQKSIQWVISNPDMHTACISMRSFDLVDNTIPLSGAKLSAADLKFLEDYKYAYNSQYCRHGCDTCVSNCPHHLPINSIMRYAYYYETHGMEKYAMQKYLKLAARNASHCFNCDAPCVAACPHGVNVPLQLAKAHSLLTLV